jgi:hypothetical protein
VLTPADGGPAPEPTGPVALVAMSAPAFPLSLPDRPAGLAEPVYSQEPDGRMLAVFLGAGTEDAVYVSVTRDRGSRAGAPGEVTVQERRNELYVDVTGVGRFAQNRIVRDVAEALVERPVPVPLRLRLAPAGWTVKAFKDDRILTLGDPRSGAELNVHLTEPEPDFAKATGATSSESVRVNDRPATLVRAQGLWMLQAELPGRITFVLQAPENLTRAQVLELAGSVELT